MVTDVLQPEDDQRMAWVVAEERMGLDLVLEVLHQGDRSKDLVDNVERYARLGIPEYFVYDRLRQQIHGYRLLVAGATRYQRVIPQAGLYRSMVLGLDLAVIAGRLRFFYGTSELFGTADLIRHLKGMVEDFESRAYQAQALADEALADGLRRALLALVEARQLPCSEGQRERVLACGDSSILQRWLVRAATVTAMDEILAAN